MSSENDEQNSAEVSMPAALKTPDEWCRIQGVQVLDPDGWRGRNGRPWVDPISLAEFQERLATCTQRSVPPAAADIVVRQFAVRDVLAEIAAERRQQDAKWGEQNHPDRDPLENHHVETHLYAFRANRWKEINAGRAEVGRTAWDGILLEEVYEAISEDDPAKLRAELIQVAAVAAAWVKAIDRREATA